MLFVVLIGLVVARPSYAFVEVIRGDARVIDGDSIEINGENIRLAGIDAPEKSQICCLSRYNSRPCGQDARNVLERIINNRPMTCSVKKKGRYGRSIANCLVGGIDVSRAMVQSGFALVYRYFSKRRGFVALDKTYLASEAAAKSNQQGIWATYFVQPNRWRKGERVYCN